MRHLAALFAMSISGGALASDQPGNLMSAADITCASYLASPSDRSEKLDYWVAGRIVAIAPATFQPNLSKISFSEMQSDLRAFCQQVPEATLFQASAILIDSYQRPSS